MAFTFNNLFESEAGEQARLAEAPVGSKSHFLAGLPVTIPYPERSMLIELPNPWAGQNPAREGGQGSAEHAGNRIIVVLNESYRSGHNENRDPGELIRRNNTWYCQVVASADPRYPVGGHDLAIGEEELRRGRPVSAGHLLGQGNPREDPK